MRQSPRRPPACVSIGFPDTGHTAHPNHPAAAPDRSGSSRHRLPLCPMWIPSHPAKVLRHASSLPPRRPFPASRHIVPCARCNSHNFLPHPADRRPFQAEYSAQSSRAFLRLFLPSTRQRAQNFLLSSHISHSTPASLTEHPRCPHPSFAPVPVPSIFPEQTLLLSARPTQAASL